MNIPFLLIGKSYHYNGSLLKLNYICIFLGARKTLVTGSVPTENLPDKSHKAPKNERRPLVKKGDTAVVAQSPTSSQPEHQYSDIDDF